MVPEPPHDVDHTPPDDPEAVLVAHLDTIDRIVGALASKHLMSPDERDDFQGWVRMKLVEDDYATIRKHQGRSSLGTYLSAVIANLLHDRRIHEWGKWRPSAAARGAGPIGVRLERLIRRDGLSFDTAVSILRSRNGVAIDDRELARLAASFPERSRPRIEPDSETTARAVGSLAADDRVVAGERARHQKHVLDALEQSLGTLATEDRVILKLRFWEGLTVADISRALGLEQRPLYRRMERLIALLRGSLEAAGVTGIEVGQLLEEEAG